MITTYPIAPHDQTEWDLCVRVSQTAPNTGVTPVRSGTVLAIDQALQAALAAPAQQPELLAALAKYRTAAAQSWAWIASAAGATVDRPATVTVPDEVGAALLAWREVERILDSEAPSVPPSNPADWQPIETAPKNGTYVRVWPPTWGEVSSCAQWDDDKYAKKPRPYWRRTDAIGTRDSRDNPPTHWKPVDAAPEEQA